MITLEGVDWANDWSIFSKPFDDNLFYQFHYYCWDQPTTLKDIGQFLAHRKRLNAPVWVGETGEKDNTIYWDDHNTSRPVTSAGRSGPGRRWRRRTRPIPSRPRKDGTRSGPIPEAG